jgi:mono/diheme cytochrome c family protein
MGRWKGLWAWGAAGLVAALPLVAAAEDGKSLFAERCASCHQAQGQGLPGRYPPLTQLEEWLATPEGRHYVARVVMHGFAGPIEVGGEAYDGLMLTYRWRLKDPQITAVLRYLAESLNSPRPGYEPYSEQQITAIRAVKMPDAEVRAIRDALPAR